MNQFDLSHDQLVKMAIATLGMIHGAELADDYRTRNGLVLQAASLATLLEWPCGLSWDFDSGEEMDGFRPLVFIVLPTGAQLSWHLPEYPERYDGHTTERKYADIERWILLEIRRGAS